MKEYQDVVPGAVFGRLTVIEDTGEKKYHQKVWKCVCSCADKTVVNVLHHNLRRGLSTSCGCLSRKHKVREGDVYNRLKVVSFAGYKSGKQYWECLCECGNKTVVEKLNMVYGIVKSCGCLKSETEVALGNKYGKLTVVGKTGDVLGGSPMWECTCECSDKKVFVRQYHLTNGSVRSCGCMRKGINLKHGLSNKRLYRIWRGMVARCTNPDHQSYQQYGGRGITIDPSFKEFTGFLAGIPDGYSVELQLDRIDNDKGYIPGNLRWTTPKQNARNRSDNIIVTDPKTSEVMTLIELSERYNVPYHKLHKRVSTGKGFDDLL